MFNPKNRGTRYIIAVLTIKALLRAFCTSTDNLFYVN
jgi:hypothetical protein